LNPKLTRLGLLLKVSIQIQHVLISLLPDQNQNSLVSLLQVSEALHISLGRLKNLALAGLGSKQAEMGKNKRYVSIIPFSINLADVYSFFHVIHFIGPLRLTIACSIYISIGLDDVILGNF